VSARYNTLLAVKSAAKSLMYFAFSSLVIFLSIKQ
jgi:hypothetical protein